MFSTFFTFFQSCIIHFYSISEFAENIRKDRGSLPTEMSSAPHSDRSSQSIGKSFNKNATHVVFYLYSMMFIASWHMTD